MLTFCDLVLWAAVSLETPHSREITKPFALSKLTLIRHSWYISSAQGSLMAAGSYEFSAVFQARSVQSQVGVS